jgi:3-hydroxyacyl-CoA dehydrogenase
MHRAAAADAPRPKTIGILGTTPLALHLAAQSAVKGREVALKCADELTLGMAVLQVVKTLEEDVKRGAISIEQYRDNINRIRPTVGWKNLGEATFVIDADTGGREFTRDLIRDLERQVPHESVIAVLQPWLSASDLQNGMEFPGRLLGMHLPAPVGRAPLVEILVAPVTNDTVIQAARGIASLLGKIPIVAQEASGGAVNRIWCAGVDESLRLLQEGIAPERVEQAMRRFGMVYSPLEYLDFMGVEEYTLLSRRLASDQTSPDDPIVTHMLERRWLGVKTGTGFYRHARGKLTPNRALDRWLRRSFAERATPMSKADQKALVQQRLVARMANEAFRCLDDGVMKTADEVDLAMMLTGWAPHRGGPCRYAEQVGYGDTVAMLEQLAQQHGERYAPSPGLKRLAES